jgi:hypothetical protein
MKPRDQMIRFCARHGAPSLIGSLFLALSVRGQLPTYHLARRIIAESSATAMLIIDSQNRRLYGVGNEIIDVGSGEIVGQLPGNAGHQYAIAPELGVGLTRHGAVFDLRTGKVLAFDSLSSGIAVVYDSKSQSAFVIGDTAVILAPRTGAIVGRVPLPAEPHFAVADGNSGRIFVDFGNDSILVLDSKSATPQNRWGISTCHIPEGLALDPIHNRLFVSCQNRELEVLDSNNGQVLARLPINGGTYGIGFDRGLMLLYNPNGDGTMTVIREDARGQCSVAGQVQVAEGGSEVAVDDSTHAVYLLRKAASGDRARVLVFVPNVR